MTMTTNWMCRVVDCTGQAVMGWGADLFPPVEVCARHLGELSEGALALHTNGGNSLLVKPLGRGTI